MARIRSVKPEFWASEELATVERDCRLFYIGMWNLADEHGRLRGNPYYLKGQIFPYDPDVTAADVEKWLASLQCLGNVILYKSTGESFIFLPKLSQHQRLEPGKVPSKLPPPPGPPGSPIEKPQVEPPADLFSDLDADLCESRADLSERDAESSTLLYGTGSMEHGAWSMEHGSRAHARAPDPPRQPADRFDEFWRTYPRREAKGAATKAWQRAITRAAPDVIIVGAARYRDDPNRDPAYTAHPTTWLNQDRWNDDPLPARANTARAGPSRNVLAEEASLDTVARLRAERLAQDPPMTQITGGPDVRR